MRHFKAKITKRSIDALKPDPSGERVYLWDTQIPGFHFVLRRQGVGSYRYFYRTLEGVKRHPTIGKHGAFTPDEARNAADAMRQAVKSGRDPFAERRELKLLPTIAELLDAYVTSERFASKAPSTQATDMGRIERHLKPLLGRRHVHTLTPGDVERARAAIREGKTAVDVKTRRRGRARVKGGEGTARMAVCLLRSVFNWAIGERIAKSNPCLGVNIGTSGTRNIIMNGAADYKRLFETLDRMEQEKRVRPELANAIRIIALTGARRGEIAGLRWGYIDLGKGLLTLPPAAHKTGRKTGKSRIIGLPAAAQAILAQQPVGDSGDYVFKPSHGNGPISLSKFWRKVRIEAELAAGIGLHGLRHSLASHMAMNGAGAAEIMTALGHTQLSTAQRYVHWAQDARQSLSERAASVVLAGLAASTNTDHTEAVEFPRGRNHG